MKPDEALVATVRANCHISDARHAQSLTLCNYLLAMRELYRWERGLPPGEAPRRADVLAWIGERETLWEAVDGDAWHALPIGGEALDPFDVEAVNERLASEGLAYGAARGRFGKPHFFLGELEASEVRDGARVLHVGREYARDIDAAPAALQSSTVVVRRDAFERWLWLKAETWEAQGGGPMRAVLEAYGFSRQREDALRRMAEEQRETLILHELGEHAAGALLGAPWETLMAATDDRRTEILLRAVRDLLADCLVALPRLLASEGAAGLHFWFATFEGPRRVLFPRLAEAHAAWSRGAGPRALQEAVAAGREHWQRVALELAAGGFPRARAAAEDPESVALR
ncbi:MAG TPA: hypothetical protein VLS49_06080 [Usitatibacter sp.]|nr:hypothetical protein [Usitatibacter sp.]